MHHRKRDIAAIILVAVVANCASISVYGQDQAADPSGVVIKPSSNTERAREGHTNVEIFKPGTNSVVQPPPKEFYEGGAGERKPGENPGCGSNCR